MAFKTMPIGVIFIGLLVAAICSMAFVPHRAPARTIATISTAIKT